MYDSKIIKQWILSMNMGYADDIILFDEDTYMSLLIVLNDKECLGWISLSECKMSLHDWLILTL